MEIGGIDAPPFVFIEVRSVPTSPGVTLFTEGSSIKATNSLAEWSFQLGNIDNCSFVAFSNYIVPS